MKRQKTTDVRALGALDLAADGKAPTEWRIFSYGKNPSDKGEFLFDEKAAKLVMAAFSKKGQALTMDYEHQALNAPDNGKPAPNSCYSWTPEIRTNAAGKPELWATNAKWTDAAARSIEAREYLYFSPAFETEPNSMRVARILNMALTNIPALDNQEPLVAASNGDIMSKKMTCKACSKMLRAPTDDDDGDEVACAAHLHAATQLTALSSVVGLKADAGADALSAEVRSLTSFRSAIVAHLGVDSIDKAMGEIVALKARAGQVETLQKEIADKEAAALTAELDGVIAEAAKSGKIAPAELEATIKPILALSGGKPTKENIAVIKGVVGKLVPKVTTADDGGKKPSGEGAVVLSAADKAMARFVGNSEEETAKFLTEAQAGKFVGGAKKLSAILQPTAQQYYNPAG